MIIMKFGGSSVGSVEAIQQAVRIVDWHNDCQPVVVVSAMLGVTDKLLRLIEVKMAGNANAMEAMIESLVSLHLGVAIELGRFEPSVVGEVEALLDDMKEVVSAPFVNEDGAASEADSIVSFGERLSAVLFSGALRSLGLTSRPFDARGFVFTDCGRHGSANVDYVRTYMAVSEIISPYVQDGGIPVVTGFIGSGPDGRTTILGRNGSDYTATLMAAGLRAKEVWLWKEVDGVLSSDPRIVPEAKKQSELTYDEAAELSHFGTSVLHPKTMIPVIERGIPIRIRNTFAPEDTGTCISAEAEDPPNGVRAVSAIRELAMVTVEGKGMIGIAGFAAKVFGAAGESGANILMFSQSSSEQNICLVCNQADAVRLESKLQRVLAPEIKLRQVERIRIQNDISAVAVVGEGMVGRIGVAGRTFSAVADAGVNVLAIAQGSSERIISFLVRSDEVEIAVRAVHNAFNLGRVDLEEENNEG
jgi:bifunctional aspartokinase / homoserine dehydrogenase 1